MTALSDRLSTFTDEIKKQKEPLNRLKGDKEQIEKQILDEGESLTSLQDEQKLNSQASLFMLSEIVERRQSQLEAIQSIATSALQQIYGEEYSLKFDTFEE